MMPGRSVLGTPEQGERSCRGAAFRQHAPGTGRPDINVRKIRTGKITALVLSPKERDQKGPGILWLHGGGYILGSKEKVLRSRAADLVREFGAVVISPGYRLAWWAPYPAALTDCYQTLLFMKRHADRLGIREDQMMVGGESAGGGLAAAVCILARDRKEVPVAHQMLLYPMLSNIDTETSRSNHGRVWNTRRNHIGWKMYLRNKAGRRVCPYASPIWLRDYAGLPSAYGFVGEGDLFRAETETYFRRLRAAGVEADLDLFPTSLHAFDRQRPEDALSKEAAARFEAHFRDVLKKTDP